MEFKVPKNIFICTNGCIRRKLDSEKLSVYFSLNGYKIVTNPDEADLTVFLGCGVVKQTALESLNSVKEFQRYDTDLIVGGCITDIEREKISEIFNGCIINTKDIEDIDRFFPNNKIKFKDLEDTNHYKGYNLKNSKYTKIGKKLTSLPVVSPVLEKIRSICHRWFLGRYSYKYMIEEKDTFKIRIGWGCRGNCAYCAIKVAVGPLKSKSIDRCINEFKKGLKQGFKRFMITADDTGAFGLDIDHTFPELLCEITKIPGDYEVMIVNFDPCWVAKYVDKFAELSLDQRKKIIHFEVPIQSGNSRVLKRMQRMSNVEKMKQSILKLMDLFPNASFETNIMVGFPSETFEEFKDSLEFLRDVKFDSGFTMEFQSRPGTVALEIEPKIPREETIRRYKFAKKYLKKNGYKAHNKLMQHHNDSSALTLRIARK